MAEAEERPSKIRKIARSEDGDIDAVASAPAVAAPTNVEAPAPVDDGGKKAVDENLDNGEEQPTLSKRARKKLAKREAWAAGTDERRAKRREKAKERKARKAEQSAAQGPAPEPVKRVLRRPLQTPVGLVLDCQFDEYMTDKELVSLGAQLTRSYSDNRTSPYRSHLVVSSWGGRLKSRFETVLSNNQLGWKGVAFDEGDFVEAATKLHTFMKGPGGGKLVGAFAPSDSENGIETDKNEKKKSTTEENLVNSEAGNDSGVQEPVVQETEEPNPTVQESAVQQPELQETAEITEPKSLEASETPDSVPSIVYLTADSENTIDRLSPYTSYIIGGIVDKNRYKNLCQTLATKRGIPTAKLPIGEYMTMQSRTVLTVNHVVEIMLKWLETGDWGEAFLSVIPKRKEAKLKRPRDTDGAKVAGDAQAEDGDGDADDQATGEANESLDEDDSSDGDIE
ncbi:tRNA (guanine(9)-N1)-methyltransferase [Phlyctema vagabunda]|uniref:tRNA (guanine(9)-N1)-methyltransferase n=1 Tax=Phlyctema vagabunda TaxID=108571 RepID=A0ABR4PSF8_9HELO